MMGTSVRRNMDSICLVILVVVARCVAGSAKCEKESDEGAIGCVKVGTFYEGYQTAICVKEATLQQANIQKIGCQSGQKVCWLACTDIATGREGGKVAKHCACDGSGNSGGSARNSNLGVDCFVPKGDNCDWYTNCLEKEFQCEQGNEDFRYAITYADKYCKRYEANLPDFTDRGKQWVNATRRCLQLALVPMLMREKRPTCKEIKKYAFDSHVPCYFSPAPGAPSVCDFMYKVWSSDFFALINTLKGALLEQTLSTLQGAVSTDKKCTRHFLLQHYKHSIESLKDLFG